MNNLNGTINTSLSLNGKIIPSLSLNGKVGGTNQLSGKIAEIEQIKGKIESKINIIGAISLNNVLKGTLTIGGSGSYQEYSGSYEIIPKPTAQTLKTTNKLMRQDVEIMSIPYFETSNVYGNTVYIGSEMI